MAIPSYIQQLDFASSNALVEALADYCQEKLAEAIAANGSASLMVSGGSTPKVLFPILAKRSLDWNKVTIGLVDDRWLPEDHPDSNEAMVKRLLLTDKASQACFIPMYKAGQSHREAYLAVEKEMLAIPQPFTLCLLGMGEDGHTASLHPCSKDLADALATEHLVYPTTPGEAPHDRMTLSLKGLMASSEFVLMLTGDKKREVLEKACADLNELNRSAMPIRYLLAQETVPFTLFWSP